MIGLIALMLVAGIVGANESGYQQGPPPPLFVFTGQSNAGQQGRPGQVAAAAVAPAEGLAEG